ncbi:hypothetical protein ILUMI_25366 [Ignelater luminosus]|uniref:Uncharacterized protein n=1 Tax=Ignelater luminosus TaxID=2038154 RepID=A0A8K0C5N5_IGNLU|nr:hypothetical protein ILUMI_25366 [Ignelater luminosus]
MIDEFERSEIILLRIRKGKATELLSEHLLIYSGVEITERAKEGATWLMNKKWKSKITNWDCINSKLLMLKVSTSERENMNLIVVHGPNEKDEFYEKLQEALDKTKNQVIVVGALNARVGKNTIRHAPHIGKFDERHINNHGRTPLDICMDNELIITNTLFEHKNIHKYTRVLNSKEERSMKDHIIVSKNLKKRIRENKSEKKLRTRKWWKLK